MKFHYAGKYSGNPEDLPSLEHEPGAVRFKEAEDMKQLSTTITIWSFVLLVVTIVLAWIRARDLFLPYSSIFLYLLTIIPHEFLHAICFKDDVYLYQDLKHGMFFVVGPERMSKGWFIFKCLLPSIVFGFIPYIIFMIHPQFRTLGILGAMGIATAAGDYYNVINAIKQVPGNGWIYAHKMHTYWYVPQKKAAAE